MATRKKATPEKIPSSVSPAKGIDLLNRLIQKGEELLANRPLESVEHRNWENTVRDYFTRAFGSDSQHMYNVLNAGSHSFTMGQSEQYYERIRAGDLTNEIKAVKNAIEILQLEIELDSPVGDVAKSGFESEKIFLVHGHNDGLKETVARLLEKLELEVTVLHEQPSAGRTIIEKFVEYSDVGFAVVLLTGDDRGGTKNQEFDSQLLRARQNVIFELGYFIGKIGRNRVCAIYEKGVEIPSDYQGVLFVPYDDNGQWKLLLGREMKAVGMPIDMNKLF